jgi:hypothetical protein
MGEGGGVDKSTEVTLFLFGDRNRSSFLARYLSKRSEEATHRDRASTHSDAALKFSS